jgi:hypothetical protein
MMMNGQILRMEYILSLARSLFHADVQSKKKKKGKLAPVKCVVGQPLIIHYPKLRYFDAAPMQSPAHSVFLSYCYCVISAGVLITGKLIVCL